MAKTIYKTTLFVTAFSVAEKLIGFLYRIVLSRNIGAEGMGVYQIALSVFGVLVTVSTGGLPITLSRIITKYKAEKNDSRIGGAVTGAILITLAFCLPVTLILTVCRPLLDLIFTDERCKTVFLILLPGFTFTSVYAMLRGVFWGNKDFMPYSAIEMFEEFVMAGLGSLFAWNCTDIFVGAKQAALAITVSYVVSFLTAAIYFFCKGGRLQRPKGCIKTLISSALPITTMRAGGAIVGSLMAIILPAILVKTGLSASEAMSEYGVVFGMSLPVLSIPGTLLGSMEVVAVPEISGDYYKKDFVSLRKKTAKSLRFTMLLVCLLIPLFAVLGEDVGNVLYSNAKSGSIIRICSPMLLPMSLAGITTSILNSLGCEKQTLFGYVLGAILMMICVLALPWFIGIYAMCLGLLLCQSVCAIANLSLVSKKCGKLGLRGYALRLTGLSVLLIGIGFFLREYCLRSVLAFWAMCITGGLIGVLWFIFTILPVWIKNKQISFSVL